MGGTRCSPEPSVARSETKGNVNQLNNFMAQPRTVRWTLLRAWWLLWEARIRLSLQPFTAVGNWAQRRPGRVPASPDLTVGGMMWCVEVMAPYTPKATCLVQALAGQRLLARCGLDAALHIGVAQDQAGELEAHAWLDRDGAVILGDQNDLTRFKILTSPGSERSLRRGA